MFVLEHSERESGAERRGKGARDCQRDRDGGALSPISCPLLPSSTGRCYYVRAASLLSHSPLCKLIKGYSLRRMGRLPRLLSSLSLSLLPAFYFLPLSGNKTKQPLGGKKSLTDIRRLRCLRCRRFFAVGFSLSPHFSLFFAFTHPRDGRTDGQF